MGCYYKHAGATPASHCVSDQKAAQVRASWDGTGVKTHLANPIRSAPFEEEPGYYELAGLWLYGNVRLLDTDLAHLPTAFGPPHHGPEVLDRLERETEELVLSGRIVVTGIHNPAHQRAAVVPLRWGSPRIVIVSGGFMYHLGLELDQEPFRAARLWRYRWDPQTDLIISRRAPEKFPTYAQHNPTVDRLIERVSTRQIEGPLFARSQ
jgi:hypothetical protein